jgi:hypothetical protein
VSEHRDNRCLPFVSVLVSRKFARAQTKPFELAEKTSFGNCVESWEREYWHCESHDPRVASPPTTTRYPLSSALTRRTLPLPLFCVDRGALATQVIFSFKIFFEIGKKKSVTQSLVC